MTLQIREYLTEGQRLLALSRYIPAEVARLAGVARQRVTDWRTGRARPNPTDRVGLERAIGVPARMWDAPPVAQPAPGNGHGPTPEPVAAAATSTPEIDVTAAEGDLAGLGLDGLERLARQLEALAPTLPPRERVRCIEAHVRTLATHEQLRQRSTDARAEWLASSEFQAEVRALAAAFPEARGFRERVRKLGITLPEPAAGKAKAPDPPRTLEELDELIAELGVAAKMRKAGEPFLALSHVAGLGIDVNAAAIGTVLAEHPERAPTLLSALDLVDERRVRSALERALALKDVQALEPSARVRVAELLRQLGHEAEAVALDGGARAG